MFGSREKVEIRAVGIDVAVVIIIVVVSGVDFSVVGVIVDEGDGFGSVAVVKRGDEGEYGDGNPLVGASK